MILCKGAGIGRCFYTTCVCPVCAKWYSRSRPVCISKCLFSASFLSVEEQPRIGLVWKDLQLKRQVKDKSMKESKTKTSRGQKRKTTGDSHHNIFKSISSGKEDEQ